MWGNITLFNRTKSIGKNIEKNKYLQKLLKKNIEKQ